MYLGNMECNIHQYYRTCWVGAKRFNNRGGVRDFLTVVDNETPLHDDNDDDDDDGRLSLLPPPQSSLLFHTD
jgi:hypothetical protein